MHPQHLARQCSPSHFCEALAPHRRSIRSIAYRSAQNSFILEQDCTQAVHTSKIRQGLSACPDPLLISDRRIQCQMLSKVLWPSVCSSQCRLASRRPKTITSSWSPSRWSPSRPASMAASSNLNFRIVTPGQADGPASTLGYVPQLAPISGGVA